MATNWHIKGEKQGKNVGVIWTFDLESRTLMVYFAILSATQGEESVKKAVAEVFGMQSYANSIELTLRPDMSALQFVTTALAKIDKRLGGQEVDFFNLVTVF